MKRPLLILAALVLTSVLTPDRALAQEYPVAEVHATGSTRFSEQDILRTTGIEKSKQAVPLSQVKDAATKLLGMGAFKEVGYKHVAAPGGMKVEFVVKDADQFVRADFDNIVWLSPADLITELHQRVPLFSGELPMQAGSGLQDEVAAALQSLLNERGVRTTVSYEPTGAREGITDAYVYHADDVEVKISQLNFAGTSPTFSPLLEAAARPLLGTHFQRSTLAKFAGKNLLDIYRSKGFLRAEFGAPQVTLADHKDAEVLVAVTLPVTEGRAYTFGGVRWKGNVIRPVPWLERYLHLSPGGVADGVRFDADLTKIREEYAAMGYMHMYLNLAPVYNEAAGTVSYDATIHEGELFKMGKLDIAGLQPSSEERVRQRWRMREGDAYDSGYVLSFFATNFRLPPGIAYVVEQSEGEEDNSIDLTLIFCKAGEKCLASAPNQLYIPDDQPRRK